jgi:hypothetical protein
MREIKSKNQFGSREEGALKIYGSLCSAIQIAGGTVISWQDLNEMTASDLLRLLGCNHIIFTVKRE